MGEESYSPIYIVYKIIKHLCIMVSFLSQLSLFCVSRKPLKIRQFSALILCLIMKAE